jgi:biopolymer transport protein ExbD
MGAVDTPQPGGGGKGKKKARVGIRIDMTPLVDVAFLLLIFFMVTTVFRTPQALEINLPPKDNPPVPIAKSNILTILALPGERFRWTVGDAPSKDVEFKTLPTILKAEKAKNPERIVVVIKIHPEARFHAMVDIIDELDALKLNRFALAPMTEEDKKAEGAL